VPTVQEFREALVGADAADVVDHFLLSPGAAHVSDVDIAYIASEISFAYTAPVHSTKINITGSAKLGFSLVEKKRIDLPTLPRYRAFSALSDIDVAIISPQIFDNMWHELSRYYHGSRWLPPDTKKLGHYLAIGWLRPDHFPRGVHLPQCTTWRDTFVRLSAEGRFKRHKVAGAPFYSVEHLKQYLSRSVADCIALEGLP